MGRMIMLLLILVGSSSADGCPCLSYWLPFPVRYAFDSDSGAEADHAELVLWAQGIFVKGYLRFLEVDAEPVPNPENYLVTRALVDGVLRMTQMGAPGRQSVGSNR